MYTDEEFFRRFKEYLPEEMKDFFKLMMKVEEMGAEKYDRHNYLRENGSACTFRMSHDSMFHHLARSFANQTGPRGDAESGIEELAHMSFRAAIAYTRLRRGLP